MNEELFGERHEEEQYGLHGIEHHKQCFLQSVSNNEVAVCDCAIPTRDADNEFCTICGKLLYNE